MKFSLIKKLEALKQRHQELSTKLSEPEVIGNQNRFRDLSKEYSSLEPVVECFNQFLSAQDSMIHANELLKDSDKEIKALAEEELKEAKKTIESAERELEILLLPKDPNDEKNIYLEIRAGAGGDEASIFSGDLFRMYSRFAETQGWRIEMINESLGEKGGYKEIIARIDGQGAYSKLKFESGAHRVQRVPETESQGRIHTSTCTVAVLPEAESIDEVDINPADIRIDTFRASGAGGQHVNVTDSAVRITHIPTGVVAECQDERSQHKNKAKAMALLSAKILAEQRAKLEAETAATRKSLVGTGDRSERIRTYNYPQGRLTDHRINLTLYKLTEIMEGALEQVIESLVQEHQAALLAEMGD